MVNKFLYPNGGSETYMFKLGKELSDRGHRVEYFGMQHPDNCVSNSVSAYTQQMDFHSSNAVRKVSLSLKTIYSKEARKKIRLVLDDFQPDVVHLNNFNFQLTPSIIVEIRKWEKESGRRVKIIFTAHDSQLVCPNHLMKNPNTNELCEKCLGGHFINCTKGKCVHSSTMKSVIGTVEAVYWNSRNIYDQIDKIICCSEFIKTKLDTNPVLKSKTFAFHNFIDSFEKTSVEKKDYVIYFGRYSQEKGVKTLVNVCRELPGVSFIFAGKGPLENELEGIDNVKNVGFKTGKEFETLIRQAKFSVYPSEWYENCPFSVMESISMGTPVIGANIGGIPELIDNGKTGILFKSGDKEELKNTILKAVNDKTLALKMAENCKKAEFDTLGTYTDKLIDIYGA